VWIRRLLRRRRRDNKPRRMRDEMKRSEINQIMRNGLDFLEQMKFHLPPFATWSPADWTRKGTECRDIIRQQLGWDITDFGSGDFESVGLFLFTIRNGTLEELEKENGKVYGEKVLIVEPGQITPTHFHFQKMEDIINRGGVRVVGVIQYGAERGFEGSKPLMRGNVVPDRFLDHLGLHAEV